VERLTPLVARLRDGAEAEPCTACPVCTALATLRGDRPELAGRLAEQATGLLATLREALDPPAPPTAEPAPARPVQRIPVDRATPC
jgi:hypothetical protein